MKKYLILFIVISFFGAVNAQREEIVISNAHSAAITATAINFNGSTVLSGGADARVYLWNTITGRKEKGFAAQKKEITDIRYNSDESLFATAAKSMDIVLWNKVTMKPLKVLKHTAEVLSIGFFPFSNHLAAIDASGSIKLWDATNGRILRDEYLKLPVSNVVSASIQIAHDGQHIAAQADGVLYLFNTDSYEQITNFKAALNTVSRQCFDFSHDGQLLGFKNPEGKLVIADAQNGKILQTLSEDFTNATTLIFAGNSKFLLVGDNNGKIQVIDVANRKAIKQFAAHQGAVVNTWLSLNGENLITAGADLKIKKWDVKSLNFGYGLEIVSCPKNVEIKSAILNDDNQNGLLDANEKANVAVIIRNNDNNTLYDAVVKLNQKQSLGGLELPVEYYVGNILPSAQKEISIPVVTKENLAQGNAIVSVELNCTKNKLAAREMSLQAGSSAYAGLAIKSYKFYSPSGKSSKGEPITIALTIENITRVAAENVVVTYKLPAGVSAIDKIKETIPHIAPNTAVTVSMQFITDKTIPANEINLGADISGVAYSNAADMKMALPLNQTIGVQQEMTAMLEAEREPMRGSLTLGRSDLETKSIESSRFVALVIGIDNYSGVWNKLNNAVRDAKAVEDVLKNQYNFSLVRSLYDGAATRQAIIGELEWLVANLKPADNLLIYYSGHGDFKESLNRGFWVPADASTNSTSNFVSNPDLQTFLNSIKTKHTLLISDACFSGDIFRGSVQKELAEVNEKYYTRVNSLASRQAITSGGIEPVMDGGKDGHSVFAYYFLKALRDNNQKFVDATQLFDAIKIPVVNNSSQAPKFSHIQNTGDEGGEFVFYKK